MDDSKQEPYMVESTQPNISAWYRLFDVLLNSERYINSKLEENDDDERKQKADTTVSTSKRISSRLLQD